MPSSKKIGVQFLKLYLNTQEAQAKEILNMNVPTPIFERISFAAIIHHCRVFHTRKRSGRIITRTETIVFANRLCNISKKFVCNGI